MSFPLLEVRGLYKCYSRSAEPAIQSLDLEVRRGEILGLVGLNGAGKTTTIRVAAGVALPSAGRILVNGHDVVREKTEAGRQAGWVPETPLFEPGARALPLLRYHAGFYGLSGTSGRELCLKLLSEVGLQGQERKRFRTFSQGMKKRFALARALLGDPPLLLLDEVLNGLDPEGVRYVRELVVRHRSEGKGVLLSSHILSEVEQVADRVAIIHHGRGVRILGPEELRSSSARVLKITIENLDDGVLELLASFGTVQREGRVVYIIGARGAPAEVTAELVRRGYRVSEIGSEKRTLESYFFEAVGRPHEDGHPPGESRGAP
ncbi:MAG: ABC transporter ATP-binding protein [Euryarchaeota archaeon]|nr:ABC transporter ATP-binding protein [Euryarchaeota archaeon]MDE1837512.1 ABC transporter ATP-binding protein [Euryarchaeota archaeon]MDE1882026.1 ABC transporter ATP-binding protein [Euryarchaeota archaeon]MDE2045522.1 ABC transporter ATP-binding protein [Thermoplasmata archaeon]